MNSFIARQPIFNRDLKTVAYELLFRDSMSNYFPNVSDEHATYSMISDHLLGMPLPRLVGPHTSFINFPYQLIINGTASILPRDKVVIEILENAVPDADLLSAVKKLYINGFKIALDDFILEEKWEEFFPYISTIKFDVSKKSQDEIITYLKNKHDILTGITFLAEKVETREVFDAYADAGFTLFQGYFYKKPEVIQSKKLSPNRISLLKLMKEINVDSPNLETIEELLKTDVTLSYKLLKFSKNILFQRRGIVLSNDLTIREIILYLGYNELRRFVSIVCISNLDDMKTAELYFTSLARGRFCELIATKIGLQQQAHDAFFCGLFSLLDVILEISHEDLFQQISLSEGVMSALCNHEGLLYKILYLSQLYEQQKWDEARALCQDLNLPENGIIQDMQQALKWADELSSY